MKANIITDLKFSKALLASSYKLNVVFNSKLLSPLAYVLDI